MHSVACKVEPFVEPQGAAGTFQWLLDSGSAVWQMDESGNKFSDYCHMNKRNNEQ